MIYEAKNPHSGCGQRWPGKTIGDDSLKSAGSAADVDLLATAEQSGALSSPCWLTCVA
ncbi:hypothetical protein ACGF3C_10940 [Micromonospora sp. NPDC047762]|uniref:hypothetical protein n=1 Tax=Micromonospora sp. NPDC047762 TaxID=3364255 RepID=UPI0037137C65